MKLIKTKLLKTILPAIFIFTAVCGSPEVEERGSNCFAVKNPGWVDDETYQVQSLSGPGENIQGLTQRRIMAERMALLCAQTAVLEDLVGAEVKSDNNTTAKTIQGYIKGGVIVEKEFDENDRCQMIYKVSGPDLKKQYQSLQK